MNRCIGIIIVIVTLQGCSGCSESGIRSNRLSPIASNIDRNSYQDNITPEFTEENSSLSNLYKKSKTAIFTIITSDDENKYQGSGFFISNNGVAISNYHVFKGTNIGNEDILLASGKRFKIANVIEKNDELDYIIFKVDMNQLTNYLSITNIQPVIGEDVFAIGNPRGLSHTLSEGIISGYREGDSILQTTTEITHGSSGGALLNMKGQVVGITTSGYGEANLNFAINIQKLKLKRFINN